MAANVVRDFSYINRALVPIMIVLREKLQCLSAIQSLKMAVVILHSAERHLHHCHRLYPEHIALQIIHLIIFLHDRVTCRLH